MSTPDGFTGPPVWAHDKGRMRILAGVRAYKGSAFFDIREWANEGETPTGKGATIPLEAISGFAEALTAFVNELALSERENGS